MSFIEHYRLAEIVGQPTAATTGNVNVQPQARLDLAAFPALGHAASTVSGRATLAPGCRIDNLAAALLTDAP